MLAQHIPRGRHCAPCVGKSERAASQSSSREELLGYGGEKGIIHGCAYTKAGYVERRTRNTISRCRSAVWD